MLLIKVPTRRSPFYLLKSWCFQSGDHWHHHRIEYNGTAWGEEDEENAGLANITHTAVCFFLFLIFFSHSLLSTLFATDYLKANPNTSATGTEFKIVYDNLDPDSKVWTWKYTAVQVVCYSLYWYMSTEVWRYEQRKKGRHWKGYKLTHIGMFSILILIPTLFLIVVKGLQVVELS